MNDSGEPGRAAEAPERFTIWVRKTLIVLALVVLALLLWKIAYALLLAFGGVLLAVFLRGFAGKLHQWTGLSVRWSLAAVGIVLVAAIAAGAVLMGSSLAAQFGQLTETLTQGISQVRGYLEQTAWGKQLLSSASQSTQRTGSLLSVAASALTSVADALLAIVLALFAGIYFAVAPRVYTEGVVRLFPRSRHERVREVLATAGNALWLWLLGQFVVMLTVAVLTAVGLLLIGVPLAVPLGILAGLLEFVPFLGPIVAAIPVLLVALTVGPTTTLYAALLFLAIQQVESNLLEPLVERKAVAVPPVLILIAAIAFTLLFGLIGTIFATPLLVVVIVCVKMLYMQDVLGERAEPPGSIRRTQLGRYTMAQPTATEVDIHQLFNTRVYDCKGEAFARVVNVWTDEDEHPCFLGIQTNNHQNHVVPARGAELSSRGDKLRLAYDKETVNASPTCDPKKDLRDEDVRKVCDFFQGKGPDL